MSVDRAQFCANCPSAEKCQFSADKYIGGQTIVGLDWDVSGRSADRDPDMLFMDWTRFFAEIYKNLIKHGLSPEQFATQFPSFQQTLIQDCHVLKWAASWKNHKDIELRGVSGIVQYRISIISTEAGVRAGLLLELQFPHVDDSQASSERSHFFPDLSDAAYPPNFQEMPMEARVVAEGPCSPTEAQQLVSLIPPRAFASSPMVSIPA